MDELNEMIQKGGVINWTNSEKKEVNTMLVKARLKERQRQLKMKRGGKHRHEMGKKIQAKKQQEKEKKEKKEKQQQEEKMVFEVPGTDTEFDTVRLNLDEN